MTTSDSIESEPTPSAGRQLDRDLVVIGAGPAGAATAITAARAGANVTVFDKASYGRDKVCGDGLTPQSGWCSRRLGDHPR